MKTGIIIPCYNEENRLDSAAFVDFIKNHENYHLCFVNDGSSDGTLDVLHSMQRQSWSQIDVVDMKKNGGKAAAVRAGARFLSAKEDMDYIGFIDADLSTDFRDFKLLVETLDKNEELALVYGSRAAEEGIERNFFRGLFSKIIKMIIFLILRLPIKDTQCGAKVFRKKYISLTFDKSFMSRWLFDVEVFIRLKNYFGGSKVMNRVHEQPLKRWVHVDDSKLGLKDALQIPYQLISIWVAYTLGTTFA